MVLTDILFGLVMVIFGAGAVYGFYMDVNWPLDRARVKPVVWLLGRVIYGGISLFWLAFGIYTLGSTLF